MGGTDSGNVRVVEASRALFRTQEGQLWRPHFVVEGAHCFLHRTEKRVADFVVECCAVLFRDDCR